MRIYGVTVLPCCPAQIAVAQALHKPLQLPIAVKSGVAGGCMDDARMRIADLEVAVAALLARGSSSSSQGRQRSSNAKLGSRRLASHALDCDAPPAVQPQDFDGIFARLVRMPPCMHVVSPILTLLLTAEQAACYSVLVLQAS